VPAQRQKAPGGDGPQTEDGRYRLLVEAVTDYAIWVLILIVSHNLGLRASWHRGIRVRQIGQQRNFGSFVYCQLRFVTSTPTDAGRIVNLRSDGAGTQLEH
jgi:hypothetical protein